MIDSLLADAEIVDAARRLRPDSAAEDTIASTMWSVITEPGDGVAGSLISELGAAEALRIALDPAEAHALVDSGPLTEGRSRWSPRATTRGVLDALRGAVEVDAKLLLPGDAEWPLSLDELGAHTPAALWVRGDASCLAAHHRVAIIGARAATAYGEQVAADIAGDLAASGTLIVSGGAYGIDGAAHRAALGAGGRTLAFLAGGVDRAYPAGHQQLFGRIIADGAVVSELPCGAAPTKWRFLSRNRLIAALGMATVVIEAGWRSGSLNTAGHAAALGRPLGAVPGAVTSAASAGCHRLLREYDATCVTSAAEVRELWGADTASAPIAERIDPDQLRLGDALSTRTARTVSELAQRSGLAPQRVTALLGLLSLEGSVLRVETGWKQARQLARATR